MNMLFVGKLQVQHLVILHKILTDLHAMGRLQSCLSGRASELFALSCTFIPPHLPESLLFLSSSNLSRWVSHPLLLPLSIVLSVLLVSGLWV